MGKFFYRVFELQFFVLWLLAVVIPKNQFKVIFVSEIFLFFIITVYNILKIRTNLYVSRQGQILWGFLCAFFILAGIMLYLSYNDLPSFWDIPLLLFDKEYIFRHFMVIMELFLSVGLGYTMMRTQTVFKMKNKHLFIIAILVGFIVVYHRRYVIFMGGLYVAVLSLLAIRTRQKWLYLFIPFVLLSHSAYLLASVVMLTFVILKKKFNNFFSNTPTSRIILLLSLLTIALLVNWDFVYHKILSDPNSHWRWQVWTNEWESLKQTMYTGVGFGSAYITSDVLYIVNNANMYIDSDGRIYDNLFLVANHNSIMNMFYRLGIIGGLLFVSWNIMLCSISLTSYKKKLLGQYNEYCWWAFINYMYNFVVIALNPGMEMMQFAINYTFSLGLMFAVIFSSNRVIAQHCFLSSKA